MIWATVTSSLVFADCIELLHLRLQRIKSTWFWYWPSGDIHVYSHLLCCWKVVFAMTSAFSWQNSISLCLLLCPASFCTARPNFPVTSGISWLPTFAFQSPIMKGHLFWVLVLQGLVGLHRTVQLQLLQRYWLGHRLGLLWYWMVCPETNRDHSVVFEIASKYCISDSCWPWWLLHVF